MEVTIELGKYYFGGGMQRVPSGEIKEVRRELMNELGCSRAMLWSKIKNGLKRPRPEEMAIINSVLSRHGVDSDIWSEIPGK